MSTFELKFFAKLRESLGTDSMAISTSDVSSTATLLTFLKKQNPSWTQHLEGQLLIAVNQQMVHDKCDIHAGDEVALMPPVTGG